MTHNTNCVYERESYNSECVARAQHANTKESTTENIVSYPTNTNEMGNMLVLRLNCRNLNAMNVLDLNGFFFLFSFASFSSSFWFNYNYCWRQATKHRKKRATHLQVCGGISWACVRVIHVSILKIADGCQLDTKNERFTWKSFCMIVLNVHIQCALLIISPIIAMALMEQKR